MDRLLLPLTFVLMEAAWLGGVLAIWGRWLDRADSVGLLPLVVVALTLGAGYLAGRTLLRRDEDEADTGNGQRRLLLVLALGWMWSVAAVWVSRHAGAGPGWLAGVGQSVADVWVGPRSDLAALVGAFVLWWRGTHLGARTPDYAAVVRSFGLGSLLLAAAFIVGATGLGTPADLVAAAPLFLASGLPALSLGRLEEARVEVDTGAARGNAAHLSAGWLRAAGPPVAAVLLAGFIAALVLGDEASRAALLEGLGRAGLALWGVLYWPLLALGYLAEWLVYLLRALPLPRQPPPHPPPPPDPLAELRRAAPGGVDVSPAWLLALRWGAAALVAAALLAGFFASSQAVGRPMRAPEPRPNEEREALLTWRGLLPALLRWLRDLFGRWRAGTRALAETLAAAAARPASPANQAVGDARAAYRHVLALGRDHDVARDPAETADEYHRRWRDSLPGDDEVAELTVAYTRARYGGPSAASVPVTRLRAALTRLRTVLARPDSSPPGPDA